MRLLQIIFICTCMMLSVYAFQEAGGWRGVVPLHSTRADVERLLGPPSDSCKCIYKTENELVNVIYAGAPCKGEIPGWNVPADTVLSFTVTPKTWQRFSDLNIDERRYVKSFDPDNPTAHYTIPDQGIKYTVTETGMVYYVSYIPSTKDSHLRCPGFTPSDGSITRDRPFDFYSDIAFDDEKARLDNFAFWLIQYPDLTGYVVVYAGRRGRAGEARARSERAKSYLVNKRGIGTGRIIAIDGGHREKLEVELYALPHGVSVPIATPTVDPSEVQIIKAGKGRYSNRRSTRPRCNRLG